ncbi:hypothetical protein EDD17DRAFT_1618011 [Pisolithus thermaeus]|nr:hypothetical protein EDD17DRAFT_1618011 [Pisolithus thermaeus]
MAPSCQRLSTSSQVADENFARAHHINRRFGYPTDSTVEAVGTLFGMLKEHKEVEATTIWITNVKGYDGFLYALNCDVLRKQVVLIGAPLQRQSLPVSQMS